MNKVVGIVIFKYGDVVNKFIDVSWVNFIVRGSVENGIINTCRDITRRVGVGESVSVNFDTVSDEVEYLSDVICYCCKNQYGMASMVLTKGYKYGRIIVELAYKLINKYDMDNNLEKIVREYENPSSVDNIVRVQEELEKTREILNMTIDKLLERGGNIEDLVDKTGELELNSKIFFNRAKRLNSCCTIL